MIGCATSTIISAPLNDFFLKNKLYYKESFEMKERKKPAFKII